MGDCTNLVNSVGTRKVLTNFPRPRAILLDIVKKRYSFTNIARCLSTDRATEVGKVTEGNISGTYRKN